MHHGLSRLDASHDSLLVAGGNGTREEDVKADSEACIMVSAGWMLFDYEDENKSVLHRVSARYDPSSNPLFCIICFAFF